MVLNTQLSSGGGTAITNPIPEPTVPTPTPTPSPTPTPTPTPTGSLVIPVIPEPTVPPVTITYDLSSLVLISPSNTTVDYRKNSMTSIPSTTLSFTNLSNDIDIIIGIQSLPQISFTTNSFTLQKATSQNVIVAYNIAQINQLPDGVDILDVIINFSTTSGGTSPSIPSTPTSPSPTPTPTSPPTGGGGGGTITPITPGVPSAPRQIV